MEKWNNTWYENDQHFPNLNQPKKNENKKIRTFDTSQLVTMIGV